MGILDSDSDDDASTSSSEVETTTAASGGGKTKTDVTQFMNKKTTLGDYAAFKGADAEDNETAAKMMEMLQLREALGMDKDVGFMKAQAEKEAEKKKLAAMSQEERMQYDQDNAGDMMAKIRAKQEALAKQRAEGATEDVPAEEEATEFQSQAEKDAELQKKLKKEAKKKKKEAKKKKKEAEATAAAGEE